MDPIFARKRWTPQFRKIAAAAVLIGASLLPAFSAYGSDSWPSTPGTQRSTVALPLPSIPYLEATPWLNWAPYRNGLKVDTLQLPRSPQQKSTDDELRPWWARDLPIS